jgi:hypothetical protein
MPEAWFPRKPILGILVNKDSSPCITLFVFAHRETSAVCQRGIWKISLSVGLLRERTLGRHFPPLC